MATLHAKNRPPSAAKRWLPCPFSATVAPMYPNDPTAASDKGDLWHVLMEDQITFGTLPLDCDPDAAEALQDLYAYVSKRFKELSAYGKVQILVEKQLDIPETGEFGTADIVMVSYEVLEIIDEKSGYVPVKVEYNEQMLTYLLGAIALYGPRPKYKLGIHQPNYDHIQGSLRFWEPTHADVEEFRNRVLDSVRSPDRTVAGPHCKETYCEHRGACATFAAYAEKDLSLGWHTSELNAMDDATLSKALDASDELSGWRDKLRTEAMRRIMNMDRKIDGYKVVKGRRSRAVRHARDLVISVRDTLGEEWAARLFDPSLTWAASSIAERVQLLDMPGAEEGLLKCLGTPKHIEDVLKQYARQYRLPNGGWKQLYDNVVGEYIQETAGGLTLERAIDGRPAHRRGSEFGTIDPANLTNSANSTNSPIVL